MHFRGARLTRGGKDFVTIGRLNVALDQMPAPHRQLIIKSIDVENPVVRIVPAGVPTAGGAPAKPRQKLSTLFHLTRLQIDGGKVSYEPGGEPMVWDRINVRVDTTQQSDAKYTFALFAGGGEDVSIDANGTIDVDELQLDLSKLKISAHSDAEHPPTSMPPPVQTALRASKMSGEISIALAGAMSRDAWQLRELHADCEFKDAGKVAITGKASGPWHAIKPWWEAVDHDVEIRARDFAFWPRKFPQRVEHINGEPARIAHGVVTFHNLTGAYGPDKLELRSARLDLRELPARLAFREIDSTVAFAGKPNEYSPKLQKTLDMLAPAGPIIIGGDWVSVRTDREHPRYDLKISSDTAALNINGGKLPLTKVRGDARVIPGRIDVQQVSADLWGGTATAVGAWMYGADDSYRGRVTLRNIDLRNVPNQSKLKGRGFLVADVQGSGDALANLTGGGEAEVTDGDFFELPIFRALFEQIKAKQAITAAEAATLFDIGGGVIRLRRAAVSAPVLGLQGGGEVGFDGKVNLEVVAAPLSDWRDHLKAAKVPIVSDVAGELAGGIQRMLNAATGTLLYQFRIDGNVKQPHVAAVPVPVLSDLGAAIFGHMLQEKKQDDRLVDFLKNQ
jgi:hypothetical protein